ncbi:MAG TPA: hypothetical protein VKZ56_04310, partial [Membranihabitans sp.]|nr:hypothetical protein [Membranihabitans sp.]
CISCGYAYSPIGLPMEAEHGPVCEKNRRGFEKAISGRRVGSKTFTDDLLWTGILSGSWTQPTVMPYLFQVWKKVPVCKKMNS